MKRILLINLTLLLSIVVLFATLILSFIYTDLKHSIVKRQNPEGIRAYQVWADGVLTLQKKQNIIKKLDKKDCVRLHSDDDDEYEEKECEVITFDASKRFDVNSYFTVLKNIAMEKGYVLDYHYNNDDANAKPNLYARKIESPRAPMPHLDKTFTDELYSKYKARMPNPRQKRSMLLLRLRSFM